MLNDLVTSRVVVIPSRMSSSRFPGKPLAKISGTTMLARVIKNAVAAVGLNHTIVATCDTEIAEEAARYGVAAVMTSPLHERASDRTAEAIDILEHNGRSFQNIVMLQGDEPLISASLVATVFGELELNSTATIVNLVGPITSSEELNNPNCIKVVAAANSAALYFSRSPIPYSIGSDVHPYYKQVCAIGFTRDALDKFARQPPGPLETLESIDMLRWLENGGEVRLVSTQVKTHPVDSPGDIKTVEGLLAS